jgi:hypothetical protein
MIFVVISYGSPNFEPGKAGDAPFRSHRYREKLVQEGKIVVHGHLAGQKGHLWVYNVSGPDELDRVVAEDPMYPWIQNNPKIYALISEERAHERERTAEMRKAQTQAKGS